MTIAIASSTIVNSSTTPASSFDLPPPSGLGSSDIDLVAAFISDSASGGSSVLSIANDGGAYTSIMGDNANNNGGGSPEGDAHLWYKVGAASQGDAVVSLTVTTRFYLGLRMRLTGVDLSDPIAAVLSSLLNGRGSPNGSSPWTIPGLTVPAGAMVLPWFLFCDYQVGGSAGARFSASGFTSTALNDRTSGATNHIAAVVLSKLIASAGASGDCVVTPVSNASTTQKNYLGGMLALRPAADGPPPSIVRSRVVGPF